MGKEVLAHLPTVTRRMSMYGSFGMVNEIDYTDPARGAERATPAASPG